MRGGVTWVEDASDPYPLSYYGHGGSLHDAAQYDVIDIGKVLALTIFYKLIILR